MTAYFGVVGVEVGAASPEAVELGFKDGTRIKSEEAFTSLAGEVRFQKLLLGLN